MSYKLAYEMLRQASFHQCFDFFMYLLLLNKTRSFSCL